MDMSILGGKFRQASESYLRSHNLQEDYRGARFQDEYELVVVCNDLIMPKFFRSKKVVWVQEGMIDQATRTTRFVQALGLPRWMSRGTALNGLSPYNHLCCVASEGYKAHFIKHGVPAEKLFVTGIPNFDNLAVHLNSDFPHRNYVLVATSDIRETLGKEDRPTFLKYCNEIAKGRQLIFRLHPNEDVVRARREIAEHCPPNTLVFDSGNTNDMVAHCDELITQWSSVVYVGIALGKKINSWFPENELMANAPMQNGGTSGARIARICRDFIAFDGPPHLFARQYQQAF
jgi:hypothetical protein